MANIYVAWEKDTLYEVGDIVYFNNNTYIATKFYNSSYMGVNPNEAVAKDRLDNDVRVWTLYAAKPLGGVSSLHKAYFCPYNTMQGIGNPVGSGVANTPAGWFSTLYSSNIDLNVYDDKGVDNDYNTFPSDYNGWSYEYLAARDLGQKPTYWDQNAGMWIMRTVPDYQLYSNTGLDGSQCLLGFSPYSEGSIYVGSHTMLNPTFVPTDPADPEVGQWVAGSYNGDGEDKINVYVQFNNPSFIGKQFNVALVLQTYQVTWIQTSSDESPPMDPLTYPNAQPEDFTTYSYLHYQEVDPLTGKLTDYYYKIKTYTPYEIFYQTFTANEDMLYARGHGPDFTQAEIPDPATTFTVPGAYQDMGKYAGTDIDLTVYSISYNIYDCGIWSITPND